MMLLAVGKVGMKGGREIVAITACLSDYDDDVHSQAHTYIHDDDGDDDNTHSHVHDGDNDAHTFMHDDDADTDAHYTV